MRLIFKLYVAPVRERGLKSSLCYNYVVVTTVAPVRERGLKSIFVDEVLPGDTSLP